MNTPLDVLMAAAARMLLLRREQRHQIGPDVRNRRRGRGRYDGATLREIRAVAGVGRPPLVKTVARAQALEEWQLQAMRRGVAELVAAKRASAA